MGVHRFEDLEVWQDARELNQRISLILNQRAFRLDLGLSRQLSGAALSVMNNIAEGFLRHNDKEFRHFLRISAASDGEVRSILHIAFARGCLPESEATALIELTNRIGRRTRRLQQPIDARLNSR